MYRKPLGDGGGGEPRQLLVVVAQPAGGRRVAGIALALEDGDPPVPALGRTGEDVQGLIRREHVGEVAEIHDADEVFRAHAGNEPPDGLSGVLGPEIPHRVDDRSGGEVHGALVGPDPPQLAVSRQVAPEAGRVLPDPVEVEAHDEMLHGEDGRTADVVAAADREGEAVPFEAGPVRLQDHVGGGVVGIRVHGVRPVEGGRGRETQIEGAQIGDDGHRGLVPLGSEILLPILVAHFHRRARIHFTGKML